RGGREGEVVCLTGRLQLPRFLACVSCSEARLRARNVNQQADHHAGRSSTPISWPNRPSRWSLWRSKRARSASSPVTGGGSTGGEVFTMLVDTVWLASGAAAFGT